MALRNGRAYQWLQPNNFHNTELCDAYKKCNFSSNLWYNIDVSELKYILSVK